MSFQETTYVIMGGTTGMGLASAQALQTRGAHVVAIGRAVESCNLAQDILGNNCTVLCGDAIDEETIKKAINLARKKYGHIHGLFHVAGGSGRRFGDGALDQMTLEGWNKTLEMNLTSMMLSNREMIKYFIGSNQAGKILNMGSVLGSSPSPKFFVTHAYAAAKSAIIGFSKSIAAYYAPHNISINVIAPGLFDTPMAKRAVGQDNIRHFLKTKQPLDGGRPGVPNDIVNAVLMFLAPTTKFITGQVLSVDGGWSISEGQYFPQQ